jgi:hypothetical protein
MARKIRRRAARCWWRLAPKTAIFWVVLVVISAARASQAETAPIAIAYDADPGCPNANELLGKVREHAGIDVVAAAQPAAPLRIQIHASGETFVGRLEMQRAGRDYVREIVGPTCAETASALAFVVAQALMPEQPSAPAAETVESSGIVERTRTVIPPTVVDRPRAAPPTETRGVAWWVGIDGGVRKAPIPAWSLMESGFVDWRLPGRAGLVPSLQLGVVFSGPASMTSSDWTATVSWLAGRLSICPARMALGKYVEVVPCMGMHGGALWTSGVPAAPRSEGRFSSSPWADGFAGLRADFQPIEPLCIRLGFEVIAIVSRYDLVFDNPKTLVFPMPSTTVAGSLGVAWRAW